MTALDTSLGNISIIRPVGFYIVGFRTLPVGELYLIFLAAVYAATVLCNTFVVAVICFEHRLHTPKYIAVANLAVVDLALSTSLIPGMLKTFLAKDNFITFNICLTQMFFCYAFLTMESLSISVLAYDRLIAICFPLHQHSINTITRMIGIIMVMWAVDVGSNVFSISTMTRLSFCKSRDVYSYFCDYAPVFRLACNDYSLQWTCATTLSLVNLFGPLSFITLTYICILISVFRMQSIESRFKALSTCVEHLFLVGIFYVPFLTLFIMGLFLFGVNPDTRMLTLSLASCLPPLLNPVVYSLKTKGIRTRAFFVLRKIKVRSAV